jgi:hypothetical protein
MNYIGTYNIDINNLDLYNNKLNKDITKLKQDLELLNKNNPNINNCINIINEYLLPVLDKYNTTMNDLIVKTKDNSSNMVGDNNE